MRINIFSGGRRIAIVVGAVIAGASGFFAWLGSEPYLRLVYSVGAHNQVRLDDNECSFLHDGMKTLNRTSSSGRSVPVTLCFRAQQASDGRMLVPYRIDSDGTIWMNTSYSSDVDARMSSYALNFHLPLQDDSRVESMFGALQRAQVFNAGLAAGGGALAVWLIAAVLGWIVRGFLGVPRGADFRPPAASEEA